MLPGKYRQRGESTHSEEERRKGHLVVTCWILRIYERTRYMVVCTDVNWIKRSQAAMIPVAVSQIWTHVDTRLTRWYCIKPQYASRAASSVLKSILQKLLSLSGSIAQITELQAKSINKESWQLTFSQRVTYIGRKHLCDIIIIICHENICNIYVAYNQAPQPPM